MLNKITTEEQESALKIVRIVLNNAIKSEEVSYKKNLTATFFVDFNVDVTLWLNGNFRGSRMNFNENLLNGLLHATIDVIKDERFQPLSEADIKDVRIELTIWSQNPDTFKKKDISDKLDYSRGYQLKIKDRTAFFLPVIFNIIKLRTISDLVKKLAIQKLNYTETEVTAMKNFELSSFEVQNFIEDSYKKNSFELTGPILVENKSHIQDIHVAEMAARWLIGTQKLNGNYKSIIEKGNPTRENFDITRNTLSAWGLSEFGKTINNRAFTESARKYFLYLKNILIEESIISDNNLLSLCYLGQLSLSLNEKDFALLCAEKINKGIKNTPISEITRQQAASFFVVISKKFPESCYLELAISYSDISLRNFKASDNVDISYFVELANTYLLLYKRTGMNLYGEYSKEILSIIFDHKLATGSFCTKYDTGYTYTRLTAKIIEVMQNFRNSELFALETIDENYNDAVNWMKKFQYTKENTYFIRSIDVCHFLGSFRHDEGNFDSWTDSVGHFLLGVARGRKPQTEIFLEENIQNTRAVTLRPLIENPFLIENLPNKNLTSFYFFSNKFLIENTFREILRKIKITISKLQHSKESAVELFENKLLLNFFYTNLQLVESKILGQVSLRKILLYQFFENTPSFFKIDIPRPETQKTDGYSIAYSYAHGFNKEVHRAIGQAYGEFFERYLHSIYSLSDFIFKAVKDIPNYQKINLEKLVKFSSGQALKNKKYFWNTESIFHWEKVTKISSGEVKLAPAQLVYWNYKTTNEPVLQESNTSGLGGGFTFEQAAISGLYELIERDTFFLHWLSKTKPERINPETIACPDFKNTYLESKRKGVDTIILKAESDTGLPVFFTILSDTKKIGPMYVLGAGCGPEPLKAIDKSLNEAWSIYFWSRNKYDGNYESLPKKYIPFVTHLSTASRISIWSHRNMKGVLDFFIKSEEEMVNYSDIVFNYPKSFNTKKDELLHIVDVLENGNDSYEVFSHTSSHRIIKGVGYFSVKVIVPGLCPMYYNEENIPQDNKRLERFNLLNKKASQNINEVPHLFP